MPQAIIGALRATLGMNTAAFDKGLDLSARKLARFGKDLNRIGQKMQSVGRSMSLGLTIPIVALGAGVLKVGASFEAAMNRVEAATGAAGKELLAMRNQARAFGADKSFTATATQSAEVMEMLAKNGLSTTQILNGAAKATLTLSAATGGDFNRAADLATDIMQQFGRRAEELPGIVDKVTGALLVSKFGFEDYQLAIGQAGGVAGGLGISFEDMNAAIASTSALFASGSDAGTSFKTFLTRLKPQSQEAAAVMKQLGIEFFDAQGNMKSLGDIAQMLQDRLGGLADAAKTSALTKIFGTDAMRTAIGLMNQGADGIARVNSEINKASAADQMAARVKGLEAGLIQLKKAFESLALTLGESGFLGWATRVVDAFSDMLSWASKLPAPFLRFAGVIAMVAAAAGPLIFIGGSILRTWGTMAALIARLSPAWAALGTALTGVTGSATLAAAAMVRLRAAVAFIVGPIGAVIALLAAVGIGSQRAAQASDEYKRAEDALADAHAKNEEITALLATVTGKVRDQTLASARAARSAAVEHLKNARAMLVEAAAAQQLAQSKADQKWQEMSTAMSRQGASNAVVGAHEGQVHQAKKQLEAARALHKERLRTLQGWTKELENLNTAIAAPAPTAVPSGGGANPSFDTDKDGAGRKSRDKHIEQRREELKLQQALDVATARGDIDEERRLQDLLELKRREADYEDLGLSKANAKVAAEADMKDLQAARAAALQKELEISGKENDLEAARIRGDEVFVRQRERELWLQREIQDLRRAGLTLAEAEAEAAARLANIDAARLDMQEKMNRQRELDRQAELSRLRGDSEAVQRRREYEAELERRAADFEKDGMNPDEAREKAKFELDEAEQARAQGQFRDVIKGGFRAALDGDFKNYFKNWMADRASKAMEDALNNISDMLFKLFNQAFGQGAQGVAGAGGGGLSGAFNSIFGSIFGSGTLSTEGASSLTSAVSQMIAANPGTFAKGGTPPVGRASWVGEEGPELFVPKTLGTIIPNHRVPDWLGARADNDNGSAARVTIVPTPYFDAHVDGRAATVAAPMAGRAAMAGAQGAQLALGRRQSRRFP